MAQQRRVTLKVAAIQPLPCPYSASRESSDPSVSSAELRQLYRMRADAVAWVCSLDHRILALGGVIVQPVDSTPDSGD